MKKLLLVLVFLGLMEQSLWCQPIAGRETPTTALVVSEEMVKVGCMYIPVQALVPPAGIVPVAVGGLAAAAVAAVVRQRRLSGDAQGGGHSPRTAN